MAKGLGSLSQGFGLKPVTKGLGLNKAKGLYPSKGQGLGLYGTAQFPTILESYSEHILIEWPLKFFPDTFKIENNPLAEKIRLFLSGPWPLPWGTPSMGTR